MVANHFSQHQHKTRTRNPYPVRSLHHRFHSQLQRTRDIPGSQYVKPNPETQSFHSIKTLRSHYKIVKWREGDHEDNKIKISLNITSIDCACK